MIEKAQEYRDFWYAGLSNLLGWDGARIERFIDKYREFMADPDHMFYHEDPMRYIVTELIPPELHLSLDPISFRKLETRLQDVLMINGRDSLDRFDWAAARAKVRSIVDEEMRAKGL